MRHQKASREPYCDSILASIAHDVITTAVDTGYVASTHLVPQSPFGDKLLRILTGLPQTRDSSSTRIKVWRSPMKTMFLFYGILQRVSFTSLLPGA